MKKLTHRIGLPLGAAALACSPALAQDSSPTPTPTPATATATSEEVVRLEDFIVRESAANMAGDLLPTSRPVMSVFGNQSILDTPRSVTMLTPELIQQLDIQDFSDLAKIGAGTQQTNYYGVPGIPTIRGAKGSVYFNGMQRAFQRNEMPLSFGSIEGMDVVKGPAPGHYGAALVGGYVNLIPKSPYFDSKRGELRIEIGQYDSIRSQFDVGGPTLLLGKPAAYRVSVTGQLADSYYDRVGNDFVSIYSSVKAEIAKDVTLFTGGEYFNYKSNENAGWNRPTQQLVDSGRYVIGEPVSVASSAWGGNADRSQIYGSSALVVPASVVNAAVASGRITAAQRDAMNNLSTIPGRTAAYGGTLPGPEIAATTSGFQYTPAYFAAGGEVFTAKIDGSTVLADDSDFADSQNFFWFGDIESKRNPDRTVRLQNIVDHIATEKRSSYGYAFDSQQTVLESKLSISEEIGFLNTELTYGSSVRYTDAWQLQDFWDEPFSRRDITQSTISGNSVVFAGGIGPNGTNYWTQFGQGGNYESELLQLSTFLYGNSKITEKLHIYTSALLGYGAFEIGAPAEAGVFPSDEHDKRYTSISVSPQFRITKELTAYATLQRGTAVDPLQGGPIVGRASFSQNDLEEVGLKTSLFGGKLYSGIAAYHWRQSAFSTRDGGTEELEGKGLEFENTFKVTENLTLIGSIGYQRVTLEQPAGFRAAGLSEQDWALNGGTLPNNFSGVGNSSGGTPGNNPDRVYPGTPETQAKLFGVYNFDNGFGLSGGAILSDSYWHNYDHTIKLPSTLIFNGSIYYKKPTWDITLYVENVTDEDYFSGADPIFGAGTIITKAPERNFKVAYTYKF